MNLQLLCDQAAGLHKRGELAAAERLYLQVLVAEPANFSARHLLGTIRYQQGRNVEALDLIGSALEITPDSAKALLHYANVLNALGRFRDALTFYDKSLAINPNDADALFNRGNTLWGLQRLEDALVSYDRALAINPEDAEALNNRGNILRDLQLFEEALVSYDMALAINPDFAVALNNRGSILSALKRLEEALVSYDKLLALKADDAETLNNRGNTLFLLNRFDEALASYDKALAIKPDYSEALCNRGLVLWETNHVEEGLAEFMHSAELVYGDLAKSSNSNGTSLPHKVRHDREQCDYLTGGSTQNGNHAIAAVYRHENGRKLATPAVNPKNADGDIAERWRTATPQVVVIDNILTDEALDGLRRFCWGSTVWRKEYRDGYLGALPEYGFACPLLAQIVDELRDTFPAIIGQHALLNLWAFKYDNQLKGIKVHADSAIVNVNFWITPDEANLDPSSGGLVIWDVAAPPDWHFSRYNRDDASIREFLARGNARSVTIPYRANRAVIFNSDLFHETDRMKFKDGYLNRRINVTVLYGRRAIV